MKSIPPFEPARSKVLTVRQPWAWLIVSGQKTIENRTWQTQHRGPLYIHAGGKLHAMRIAEIEKLFHVTIHRGDLQFGAVIGCVDLVDIVSRSRSRWFEGPYGWVLRNPQQIEPIALQGRQGLFELAR